MNISGVRVAHTQTTMYVAAGEELGEEAAAVTSYHRLEAFLNERLGAAAAAFPLHKCSALVDCVGLRSLQNPRTPTCYLH